MAETWAPTLADVARHIPTRTRDTTVGQDALLGTFTEATTPTAEQAQADVDAAVRGLVADFGAMPTGGDPAMVANIAATAREAAEWRAAADIEIAYPNRQADVNVYVQLNARAAQAYAALARVLAEAGVGEVATVPQWAFPPPPPWGDVIFDVTPWPPAQVIRAGDPMYG